MRYSWKALLIPIIILSCNGPGDDCSEVEEQLEDCKTNGKFLLDALTIVEDKLDDCQEEVDSLKELPPEIIHDTTYVIFVDTLVLRDTIIKSDTIYQRDTVCVPGPECDTIMLNRILLYNGDTNWVVNTYIACPLESYQIYTDILITGFSTGMHHGEHDYEYGCMYVDVNGTDSLIQFGRRFCFDLSLEYSGYATRVMLPVDSIETIEYTFYNDNYGHWLGEYEDINIYLYGISVDSVDVFSPQYIDADVYTGWTDDSTRIEILRNGTIVVRP